MGEFVGSADMSAEYGNGIQSETVDADHRRVLMFVLDIWGDGSYADAHGSDEDEGIVLVPLSAYLCALNDLSLQFALEQQGVFLALLANLDYRYLLHFSMVIG